jgi:hypothetical protein
MASPWGPRERSAAWRLAWCDAWLAERAASRAAASAFVAAVWASGVPRPVAGPGPPLGEGPRPALAGPALGGDRVAAVALPRTLGGAAGPRAAAWAAPVPGASASTLARAAPVPGASASTLARTARARVAATLARAAASRPRVSTGVAAGIAPRVATSGARVAAAVAAPRSGVPPALAVFRGGGSVSHPRDLQGRRSQREQEKDRGR